MSGTILVSGGAGYIGSHTVLALRERGRDVLVLDDLSEGHADALLGARLAKGSMLDREFVRGVFQKERIAAVFHFAASGWAGDDDSAAMSRFRFAGSAWTKARRVSSLELPREKASWVRTRRSLSLASAQTA